MDVKATLVTKTSKAGNEYQCIEIQLTDNYKKIAFLEPSEIELLKIYNSNNKRPNNSDFNPFA